METEEFAAEFLPCYKNIFHFRQAWSFPTPVNKGLDILFVSFETSLDITV
jgi:hypothetical protein